MTNHRGVALNTAHTAADIRDASLNAVQAPAVISQSSALYFVGVFVVLQVLSLIDRSIIAVMVDELKADLRLSDFEVSLLQGVAFAIFYSTAGLFIGAAIDRYPRRLIMYIGVSAWSLATMSAGLAGSFLQLFLARMLVGLGEASIGPAVASISGDMFSAKRLGAAMSAYGAAGIVGMAVSLALGGYLMDNVGELRPYLPALLRDLADWRLVLILAGAPGLLLAFLAFTIIEPARKASGTTSANPGWKEFGQFLAERRGLLFRVWGGYGLLTMAGYSTIMWAPSFARRVLGMSPGEIGPAMGVIVGVGGVAAAMAAGFLVDKLYARGMRDAALRLGAWGLLLALPFAITGFLGKSVVAFYVGIVAVQVLIQCQYGPALAVSSMLAPSRLRGRMTAVTLFMTTFFGVCLGPAVVGALTDFLFGAEDRVGHSIALLLAVCVPLSAYLLWSAREAFKKQMAVT